MAPHAETGSGDGISDSRNGFANSQMNGFHTSTANGTSAASGRALNNTRGGSSVPKAKVNGEASQQPNILYIMADQMSAPLLKMHDPDSVIQTPNIDSLAETGVVFENAYCNSPLCAPSRFCMLSGLLPSKTQGYDNASSLNSDVPTYAHYLRREGYETVLAGKMHFIGPDQLHGFEKRLTPDIYPGDYGWAVNWDEPDERQEWFHNMSSVMQAGPCVRSNQLDFDEEVMYKSTQWLYDYVRQGKSKRPFSLTVSLTHPHDPYTITQDLWDQYEGVEIPMPKTTIDQHKQDEHSKRILKCIDLWDKPLTKESIQRARRAYFGACTYVDNQVGRLLKVLKNCGLADNTIIVFSGDHGDMLGEQGLWYKMSWHEMSSRVPLVVNYPKLFAPRRVPEVVSTMDLLPTFVDMVGGRLENRSGLHGTSFYNALQGGRADDQVLGEYMGEGTISPVVMIRRGRFKYTASLVDHPQLFDLQADPLELNNLSQSAKYAEVINAFNDEAAQRWNLKTLHQDVLESQRKRRVCWDALKMGTFTSWDYNPPVDGSDRYIRSTIPLDDLELRARYPPVDAFGKVSVFASPHGVAGAINQ